MPSVNTHPPPTPLESLQTRLSALELRESQLHSHLSHLRSTLPTLTSTLRSLDTVRLTLDPHLQTAQHLNTTLLAPAATTAARVSASVKALDDEQSRLQSVLRIVEQVIELKTCLAGLTECMNAAEPRWEEAAGYVQRARAVPEEVTASAFANETVPTREAPHPPKVTLERAAEKLCALFLQEFEQAAAAGDGDRVTTYFRLFPLIGKEEVGLGAYSRYVCTGVSKRARDLIGSERAGMFYAAVLARMLEYVASLVGVHAPLVEECYGQGMMGKVVYKMQIEIDVQGGIVLDMFTDDKAINRKLAETKAYAYPFLMNSFGGAGGGLGVSRAGIGIARSASPAMGHRQEMEDESVDVKEIDGILSEMGFIMSRWSLYFRFLAMKEQEWATVNLPEDEELPDLQPPSILVDSTFHQKVRDRIVTPFISFSTYFIRRSIEKAFELDEMPSPISLTISPTDDDSRPPVISSAVDDVMYIVNKLLLRTLHTSRYDVCSPVISTITRVLTSDFIGMIQRKMRDEYYPKPSVGLAPIDEKTTHFLVLINNLDTASAYTTRIVDRLLLGQPEPSILSTSEYPTTPLPTLFPFPPDPPRITTLLTTLQTSFSTKSTEIITSALNLLFNQVLKPKLRPLLADAFKDLTYSTDAEPPTPDDPDADSPQDQVRIRFSNGWSSLLGPLRAVLTPAPFEKLHTITASILAQILEKRLWAYLAPPGKQASSGRRGGGGTGAGQIGGGGVTTLGAIRLERDVAAVVNVVAGIGGWKVRGVFARCTEICRVMGEDEDDLEEEEEDDDDGEGRLTKEEKERVRRGVIGEEE